MHRALEYAELGWQEAAILGCAKQEGILEGLAKGSRSAEEVAKELRLSLRAAYALLSALAEMGVVPTRATGSGCSKSTEGLFWTEAIRTTPEACSCTGSS